jgi:hypothetical protein
LFGFAKIGELKAQLEKITAVPAAQMKLMYKGN